MTQAQWDDTNARCFGMLLDGRAQETGVKRRGDDATLLLVYNSHFDVVNFTLPSVAEGLSWEAVVDTNQPVAQQASCAFGKICDRSILGRLCSGCLGVSAPDNSGVDSAAPEAIGC
jgi:isoamylase